MFVLDCQVIHCSPQRSVLGTILFVVYTWCARLSNMVYMHGHLFADDTQVIGSCRPRDVSALQSRVSICLDNVATWMRSNQLQLNTRHEHALKTRVLCSAALRQLRTVRRCLPLAAYKSLVVSLVLSLLDYGNVTLSVRPAWLPVPLSSRLLRWYSVVSMIVPWSCSAVPVIASSRYGHGMSAE